MGSGWLSWSDPRCKCSACPPSLNDSCLRFGPGLLLESAFHASSPLAGLRRARLDLGHHLADHQVRGAGDAACLRRRGAVCAGGAPARRFCPLAGALALLEPLAPGGTTPGAGVVASDVRRPLRAGLLRGAAPVLGPGRYSFFFAL